MFIVTAVSTDGRRLLQAEYRPGSFIRTPTPLLDRPNGSLVYEPLSQDRRDEESLESTAQDGAAAAAACHHGRVRSVHPLTYASRGSLVRAAAAMMLKMARGVLLLLYRPAGAAAAVLGE